MKPLGNKIKLDIQELKFGAIDSDAIAEQGVILEMGKDSQFPPSFLGKTLYFKAWAVDIITDKNNNKHYFISSDSDAICGISE